MKPHLAAKPYLSALARGETLTAAAAEAFFAAIMEGEATHAQIAALLTALRVRGETPDELLGLVRALRARMVPVAAPPGTIDLCGTGGDGRHTLNVSTAASFVVAGCGVPVAKHGNRAMSSRSGGSDVLGALGIPPVADIPALEASLAEEGLAFLFAPHHHPALRHAAPVRAELGFRTIFNLAGPLANPAGVRRQLVGVHDPGWLEPLAAILGGLGAEHVWAVHGDGMDEVTLSGPTQVAEWRGGVCRSFAILPEAAGFARAPAEAIAGGTPAENAAALEALLAGQRGPYRDTVLLNAAAALMVAGHAATLRDGAIRAARAIDDGSARARLERMRRRFARHEEGAVREVADA